ncbi:MAG TPA: hypothetical protein VE057_01750 [Archangium sp.]|nr:hypothetical protein [Archangium sp.]
MKQSLAILVLAVCSGCANHFKQLYPGMTGQQVAEVMTSGPSRTEEFPEGYSAWYYGDEQCLLLRDNTVVAKQETEGKSEVYTPLGFVREEIHAQCLPPGVSRPERREREIRTPIGGIRIKEGGEKK